MARKTDNLQELLLTGRFRKAGFTFYLRKGELVGRVATSNERRSNTKGQFLQRMRMRHTVALWHAIKGCKPMFTKAKSNYLGFVSMANRLPVVYTAQKNASFIIPGTPVSDGTLLPIKQRLGEVNGVPALITNLKFRSLKKRDVLRLYTAEQRNTSRCPQVRFKMREVPREEVVTVRGSIALADSDFGSLKKGWALVLVNGKRCSSQTLITRNSGYLMYTSEEAMNKASEAYGGLTE